ncbi:MULTISPECIES: alpha/beta hydrolase [unclassified Streptomyces]|uniref:alpha/beta hydrolase n=1 Tax=unclassified Streptomyces TaxID=2593676 RepID=UPI000DC7E93C|nr:MULTISPECIES: alpha/beta hydrolase [unclassified Streptomyces]AWZ06308.1 alpha/beta hydrolase [Streptomyces sp. ICC4]AWZ17107.1 alpha/beta hydrolase [Streptomyces sp. ICC1]
MRKKRLASLVAAAGLLASSVPLLAAAQASAAPADAEYLRQKPAWHRCSADQPASYECATLKVPLDYRRPEGRTIDLAISRVRSTNPAKRHGVLLMNPGGPGGSGLDLPLSLGEALPREVGERYDLIGFDPRGVGASSPVSCGLTDAEQNFDRAYRPETFPSDVAWARTVADKCREKAGSVLPYITTRNTARDMDTIRAVLGERKISYLGYSYGTYLGSVYTQLFPDRTDRFVLDSGVDPDLIWRDMIRVWATEAEPAFKRWTRWAAERADQYHLGDSPAAVSKTFWDLVARAEREPIDFQGQKIGGDDIRAARALFFYPAEATPLVAALKEAAEGKPGSASGALGPDFDMKRALSGKAAPARPAAGKPATAEPAADNGIAVFWSVVCGDTDSWPRDPERYRRDAVRDKAAYPLYGDFASNIKPCAFWQRPLEPATPMKKRAAVLTVQNEWDSQTPLVSGRGLHEALRGSRMVLALGGEGHGVYLADPNSCATAPVTAYLVTGKLPAKDVNCRTVPGTSPLRPGPDAAPPKPLPFPPSGPNRF